METKEFLLENAEIFRGNLSHEKLLGVGRVARILFVVLDDSHTFIELLFCDAQRVTEIKGVEIGDFTHNHHNVVGGLIVNQQFAITVVDNPSCWENDIIEKSIVVSTGLIFFVRKLKKSQSRDIAQNNNKCYTSKNILSIFIFEAFHLYSL